MNNMITKDWGNMFFEKIALVYYEWKKQKDKKSLQTEKEKFIGKNTIIVTVNDEEIYNSQRDGVMNDELYLALLCYGADKDKKHVENKKRKPRKEFVYNLTSTITSIAE